MENNIDGTLISNAIFLEALQNLYSVYYIEFTSWEVDLRCELTSWEVDLRCKLALWEVDYMGVDLVGGPLTCS